MKKYIGLLVSLALVFTLATTVYAISQSITVIPTVENEKWTPEQNTDSNSASSTDYDCNCHKCGCDASGNNCDTCCDTCYTTETAHCHASVACDTDERSCTAKNGNSCRVDCNASASYVDYDLRYSHEGMDDVVKNVRRACSILKPAQTFSIEASGSIETGKSTTVTLTGSATDSWTLSVPASLVPGGKDTVSLSGSWPSTKTYTITADKKVSLKNSIDENETLDVDIIFSGITLAGNNRENISNSVEISVGQASNVLFGTWTGTLKYYISSN